MNYKRQEIKNLGFRIICYVVEREYYGARKMGPDHIFVIHQAGWPYLAFECKSPMDVKVDLKAKIRKAITNWNGALSAPNSIKPVECRANYWYPGYSPPIPYHPLWTGLLLNTTLFTLAWSILLLGPGTLRHYLRKHQNRCTTCGYNLHNLQSNNCPECGNDICRCKL